MDIFESLEQLNVSEECFDDIVSMVEAMLNEGSNLNGVVNRAFAKNKEPYPVSYSQDYAEKREKLNNILNKENLKDKAEQIPDSKGYDKKVSGKGKFGRLFEPETNFDRGYEEEKALNIESGDKRQKNKAIGRYHRKLKK